MLKRILFSVLYFSILQTTIATAEDRPADSSKSVYDKYQSKAQDIVSKMTLEEKIGQMTLVNMATIKNESAGDWHAIETYNIGAILADANETPDSQNPSLSDWQIQMNAINKHTASKQHIPLLLGTDAIHGNQHIANAVIFPHNIGLGATHDAKLINQIAAWTAYDVKQSGFNWAYAATVAVAHDYRWGRTYESFSSDPNLVKQFAREYVLGAQNRDNEAQQLRGVLTSTKHFIGDGNTDRGIDEGNVTVNDESRFIQENFPGYEGAFSADTGNVMVSYSQINNVPMSVNADYLNKYLFSDSSSFHGFTVSDYSAIFKAAHLRNQTYHETLADAINAGVDMVMVSHDDITMASSDPATYDHSNNLSAFQAALLYDCSLPDTDPHKISQQRIDQAVTRILRVKMAMGLMDKPQANLRPEGDENQIALQAAEESLVLLKNTESDNKPVIPANPSEIKHVILLSNQQNTYNPDGTAIPTPISFFDDIGAQCGGWRIKWQGILGNEYTDLTNGNSSSILSGIKKIAPAIDVLLNPDTTLLDPTKFTKTNTLVIATLAETPYAEFMGDIGENDPNYNYYAQDEQHRYLPPKQLNHLVMNFDIAVLNKIKAIKATKIPVITVLLSGRPMVVSASDEAPLNISDSFIAAWLPGTTGGEAIANAIFGIYHFRNKEGVNTLSFPWPLSMAQIETGRLVCPSIRKLGDPIPLFDCGNGLKT